MAIFLLKFTFKFFESIFNSQNGLLTSLLLSLLSLFSFSSFSLLVKISFKFISHLLIKFSSTISSLLVIDKLLKSIFNSLFSIIKSKQSILTINSVLLNFTEISMFLILIFKPFITFCIIFSIRPSMKELLSLFFVILLNISFINFSFNFFLLSIIICFKSFSFISLNKIIHFKPSISMDKFPFSSGTFTSNEFNIKLLMDIVG